MVKLLKAYDLMIESVLKPDHELRSLAKDCDCYKELMNVRKQMISLLETSRATLK